MVAKEKRTQTENQLTFLHYFQQSSSGAEK